MNTRVGRDVSIEELERFSRYGTRIDPETRRSLEHGRRIREILKQPQYATMSVPQQIVSLLAASEGMLDELPTSQIADAEAAILQAAEDRLAEIGGRIDSGEELAEIVDERFQRRHLPAVEVLELKHDRAELVSQRLEDFEESLEQINVEKVRVGLVGEMLISSGLLCIMVAQRD